MQQFYLTEIKTTDHLLHQGIFYRGKKRGLCAFLWVHGLMGKFYGNLKLYEAFARACDKYGYGFAAFNNRGHDVVSGIKKVDRTKKSGFKYLSAGAGYERFKDCIYDIDAGIRFLRAQKYEKIILVGHSTGANKVCYYASQKKNPRVLGVVLAGAVSDRLVNPFGDRRIKQKLAEMQKLVRRGKGNQLVLSDHFPPMTPRRFSSLYTPHSTEDTFDYGDSSPKFSYFAKIKKPLLVVIGSDDEYLGQPIDKVKQVFAAHAHSKHYQFKAIPKANHGFAGKEKEFVTAIVNWVDDTKNS